MSTLDRVKKVVVENLNVDDSAIKPEAHIFDDLGADSLDVMEMVMALEEEFGIKFQDTEYKEIKTIADIVKLIDAKL